jgi:hypothetical protein
MSDLDIDSDIKVRGLACGCFAIHEDGHVLIYTFLCSKMKKHMARRQR